MRSLKLLERMRATIPGVALRTSFMWGSGETESDFGEFAISEGGRNWIGWASSSIRMWTTRKLRAG